MTNSGLTFTTAQQKTTRRSSMTKKLLNMAIMIISLQLITNTEAIRFSQDDQFLDYSNSVKLLDLSRPQTVELVSFILDSMTETWTDNLSKDTFLAYVDAFMDNGNSQISGEIEKQGVDKIWSQIDTGRNGRVSSEQLERWAFNQVASGMGNSYMAEGEIENLIEEYAYYHGVKNLREGWRQQIKLIWKLVDADHDGSINYEQFKQMLNNKGIIQFKTLKDLVKVLEA